MNNLAHEQLFQLGILLATAITYVIAHFVIKGLAILISGQKRGIIRSFIQGVLLIGLFAVSVICFFNGNLKIYHIITYGVVVGLLMKSIIVLSEKIDISKTKKKQKV